jgi:CubicO group peptidase (beta-lactamase class C family)
VNAALFQGREILWSEALGLADVESERKATPESQYAIASITKTFVAVAVLILRDEGRLDLDDPIGRHIDEADRPGVTLRRMLAHLSGMQREAPGNTWETLEMPELDELLAGLADAEQVLPPGAQWHYSNLAYGLLGELVHRLAGVPVDQFVQERILTPLQLTGTTWGPGPNAATGYFVERFADVAHRSPVLEKRALAAAGGLWSTTADLARWGAFLLDPDSDVLAPETVEEMHSLQVMADQERWLLGWGLGLMLHRRGEQLFAGHDGGTVGHSSHLSYARRSKVGFVLLANTENPSISFDPLSLSAKAAEACRRTRSRGGRRILSQTRLPVCSESGGARASTGCSSGEADGWKRRAPGGGGRSGQCSSGRATTATGPSPAVSAGSSCSSFATTRESP